MLSLTPFCHIFTVKYIHVVDFWDWLASPSAICFPSFSSYYHYYPISQNSVTWLQSPTVGPEINGMTLVSSNAFTGGQNALMASWLSSNGQRGMPPSTRSPVLVGLTTYQLRTVTRQVRKHFRGFWTKKLLVYRSWISFFGRYSTKMHTPQVGACELSMSENTKIL